jgi:hypothetical protein
MVRRGEVRYAFTWNACLLLFVSGTLEEIQCHRFVRRLRKTLIISSF